MPRNCTYHNYNTRHCQNLRPFRPKQQFCKKCLRYNLPKIINTTSTNIINTFFTHSFDSFCRHIKLSILEKYTDICIVENCCLSSFGCLIINSEPLNVFKNVNRFINCQWFHHLDHFSFFWYVYENLFTLICLMYRYMVFFLFDCMYVYVFVFLLCKIFSALLIFFFKSQGGLHVSCSMSWWSSPNPIHIINY